MKITLTKEDTMLIVKQAYVLTYPFKEVTVENRIDGGFEVFIE